MKDIQRSKDRALVENGWIFGDSIRIGNPFEWVDADSSIVRALNRFGGAVGIIRWLQVFYEIYPTLNEIRTKDHDLMKAHYIKIMNEAFSHFAPFLKIDSFYNNAIEGMAVFRTQDYCFIKKFAKKLPLEKPRHLDLGPGLGTQAIYSLESFDSVYYSLEAGKETYELQRLFFRFLSSIYGTYLDLVECENFYISDSAVKKELNLNSDYRIKHVPSWRFKLIDDNTIDLVTAVFVLNDLNEAGLLWLLSNSSRVLKKGGYFYIRDSGKSKPGKNQLKYDEILSRLGFVEVKRLDIKNRDDMHGIPRIFEKQTDTCYSYEELVEEILGHHFITNVSDRIENNE